MLHMVCRAYLRILSSAWQWAHVPRASSCMAHPGTVQVYPGFVRKSSGKPGFTRLETTFWPFVVPHRPPHPRTSRTNSFSWTCQESSQIPPHYRSGGLRSSKITTTELRSTDDLLLVHTVSNTCSARPLMHSESSTHTPNRLAFAPLRGVATQGDFGDLTAENRTYEGGVPLAPPRRAPVKETRGLPTAGE